MLQTTNTPTPVPSTAKEAGGQTWDVSKQDLPESLRLGDHVTIQRSHKTDGPWGKDELWLYQSSDHEPQDDEPQKVAHAGMPLMMAVRRAIDDDTPVVSLSCDGCGANGYIKIVTVFRPKQKAAVH